MVDADGAFSYVANSYADKAEITGALERYTLDNFLGGIPLYDSGSNVLYNSRLQGLATKYIPNFGYGVGYATISSDLEGEKIASYKRYLHQYLTEDPQTFNYLNSQDSVTPDLYAPATLTYWDTHFNADKTGYNWEPVLAKTNRPVAINAGENGLATSWRVKVHYAEDGFVYNTNSSNAAVKVFKGTKIALADYLTPFKLMLMNGWARSTDMADSSTGFTGVAQFNNLAAADKTEANFARYVTGIKLNETEGSIDFTFNSPKSEFMAMYSLSSTLFSPIPQAFVDAIGVANYGIYNDVGAGGSGLTAVDSILSVGAYMPEVIEAGAKIVYSKNTTSAVASLYSIAGLHYGIYTAAKTDSLYLWNLYVTGKGLDVARVPSAKLTEAQSRPDLHLTVGDTVWKFQVNSCDEAMYEKLFGEKGTISPHAKKDYWTLKPIMSNKNFLNGLYFATNRTELSGKLGHNPATGFLSDSYMADPEKSIAYRDSDAGKAVLAERSPETNGYDVSAAQAYFRAAIEQEKAKDYFKNGSYSADNPYKAVLDVEYQDEASITEEGSLIKNYWETTFNTIDPSFQISLDIKAPASWSDVYYKFGMTGNYDFIFGSISGNTLDPVSFMNTVCSDNSSGFTLSWGTDTNVNTQDIVFDGKYWSFDALQAAGSTGVVVQDGVKVNLYWVNEDMAAELDVEVASLSGNGGDITGILEYLVVDGASVAIPTVKWYNPATRAETVITDKCTITDDGKGKISIKTTVGALADWTEEGKDYRLGYLELFVVSTVAGVPSAEVEVDIPVVFIAAA